MFNERLQGVLFTKEQAEKLAKRDKAYVVKHVKGPVEFDNCYGIWDCKSEHWVEFDLKGGE